METTKTAIKYSETLTRDEALLSAGLNWNVSARPIYDSNGREIESHKALTRDDTGKVFTIVSSRYVPFQASDLLDVTEQFLQTSAAKYARARSYRDGARISARVAIPDADFEVVPNDRCKAFLDISTSHDGSSAIWIRPLIYRMICKNGLHVWESDAARSISCRHVKGAREKLVINAREVLQREIQYFAAFNEKMKALAGREMTRIQLDAFLDSLLKIDHETGPSAREENLKYNLSRLAYQGTGQDIPGVKGTAYAAFNAVTEYVTHGRGADETREYAELYGTGADLRERAFALLTK